MNVNDFFKYAVHLGNFSHHQLYELLNYEEIEELPDSPLQQQAVYAIGQYLVGNSTGPTTTYLSLDITDRRDFLDTWFCVIKDPQTLKVMGRFVARKLI